MTTKPASLAFGKELFCLPGPSVVPDRVLQAMHRPSPNTYDEGELVPMTESILSDLRTVAGTQHHVALYIGNGHAAWEAALVNTLSAGDTALVLATGFFGPDWGGMAKALGIEVETLDFGQNSGAVPARVQKLLEDDVARCSSPSSSPPSASSSAPAAGVASSPRIKAVLVCHTDTATSAHSDIVGLRRAMDTAGHPALLMVDCIGSIGCAEFRMDSWKVDVTVGSSQKGLMSPVGLSVLWFNQKASRARGRKGTAVSQYWDWDRRTGSGKPLWMKFGGTPPAHLLCGLSAALRMLVHEEGVEAAWARHRRLAEAVWAAVGVWSQGGVLSLNVAKEEERSPAVTTVMVRGADAAKIREWCRSFAGLTLGIGKNSTVFRIGHMGHLNPPMLLGCLGTIDACLKALGIAHGAGAVAAAATIIAGGGGTSDHGSSPNAAKRKRDSAR
eukprot:COSAG01_NODE_6079_length_3864_cov_7.298008_2_plen_444_part_00